MKNALFVLAVAVIAAVLGAFAVFYAPGPNPAANAAESLPDPAIVQPETHREYGSGVHYFPVVGDEYISVLEKFYEDNPTLHCDYQGAVEQDRYPGWKAAGTHVVGHILRCYDPAIPAQDVTVP